MVIRRRRKVVAADSGVSVRVVRGPVKRNDTSRQVEDSTGFVYEQNDTVIATPYDLQSIAKWKEQSNVLNQCITAMVTNIARFGYRAVPISKNVEMDPAEKAILESFIEAPNVDESLAGVNSKKVNDYETYGFGFLEIVRDASGRPSLVKHAHAYKTRILKARGRLVTIKTPISRGGSRRTVTERKKFRRYVQTTGSTKVYFKEFGDPRKMDYTNGKYESSDYKIPKAKLATELLHCRQYSEDSYGLPRWISQLPSILGSREAEEVNLRYFEDNTVPPMILSVAGGRLTKQSFQDLSTLLHAQGVGKDRQNQIILIEAIPETSGLDEKGTVSLKVDKLADIRPSDGLFKEYDEANMSKIRSSFRLPPVVIGLSQDVTFACYDEETETLTDRGWKKHHEWQKGMRVACYDETTRAISFQEPEEGVKVYDVSNVPMYLIDSQQQNMLVTPKHRMLDAQSIDGEWQIEPIEEVVKHHRSYFRTSGVYDKKVSDANVFIVPDSNYQGGVAALDDSVGYIPVSDAMEWLGYYLADGCISQKGCGIRIGAKKPRKVNRFAYFHETLEDHGFRVRVSEEKAGTYYNVSHKGMAAWLSDNAGEGSERKYIPSMVWQYGVEDLQILFDALMFCDGSWDKREGRTSGAYSTVSAQLADDVQILATLLGYRAIIRQDRPGQYGVNPVYRVLLSSRETCQILSGKHITRRSYTGKVYCFTVPTGVFITRRNGKVAFQGNTANVSAYLAESQVFQPERDIHDEFFNKKFINHPFGLGLTTVKMESKGPNVTNPDQIVKTLTAVNVMGGVTPRSAIELVNETMQLSLPQFPKKGEEDYQDWMDTPMPLAQKLILANSKTQQTGEGDSSHDMQASKDQDIKDREEDGSTGVEETAVENGNQ